MALPTNITDSTSTLDPVLDHAQMHNAENALLNTHDAIISTLQSQYSLAEQTTRKGAAGGYAPLDSNGLVPLANIPVVTAWQLIDSAGTVWVSSITTAGALVTSAVGSVVNGYGGNYGVTTYS